MYVPGLPTPPRWVPPIAAAAWLALLFVGAFVTGNSVAERVIAGLAASAASVLFAIAGLGLVVQRWQHREWNKRTGLIAVDTLNRLATTAGGMVHIAYATTIPALRATGSATTAIAADPAASLHVPFDDAHNVFAQVASDHLLAASVAARDLANQAEKRTQSAWREVESALQDEIRRRAPELAVDASQPRDNVILEAASGAPTGPRRGQDRLDEELLCGVGTAFADATPVLASLGQAVWEGACELAAYVPADDATGLLEQAMDWRALAEGWANRTESAAYVPDNVTASTRDAWMSWAGQVAREHRVEAGAHAVEQVHRLVSHVSSLNWRMDACYRSLIRTTKDNALVVRLMAIDRADPSEGVRVMMLGNALALEQAAIDTRPSSGDASA